MGFLVAVDDFEQAAAAVPVRARELSPRLGRPGRRYMAVCLLLFEIIDEEVCKHEDTDSVVLNPMLARRVQRRNGPCPGATLARQRSLARPGPAPVVQRVAMRQVGLEDGYIIRGERGVLS